MSKPQDAKNMIAALKQHNRVCKIEFYIPNAFLKKLRAVKMKHPFPMLTFLWLLSDNDNAPALPDSFLGGSAPRLQTLRLKGIPFPGLPTLLLSTRDLVQLSLWRIPHSGYISPDAMVTCLSALARLQILSLGFRSPRSRAHREIRLPPRPTRVVLPAFTSFYFQGDSEYLEDIVSHIDTPRLDRLNMTFFNQLIFDTPLLRHFISRTESLKLLHQAEISFDTFHVKFNLVRKEENGEQTRTILSSSISCRPLDWQLSSLAQICDSALSSLPTVDHLEIRSDRRYWQDSMDNTQWLEILNPFTSVKHLVLRGTLIQRFALALEDLPVIGERVTEVLPTLQSISFVGQEPSESVKKAIEKFTAARELSGHSVTVHHKEAGDR